MQDSVSQSKPERRSVEEILEGDAGCPYYRALLATEAQGACERAYEEFSYDDDFPEDVLAAMKLVAERHLKV